VTSLPRIEPLDLSAHDRTHFHCGEPTLDDWIRRFAGQAIRRDGARTYVACDGPRVMAYYSVCAFQVERDVAPPWVRIGGHPVPAILLARLAVDRSAQGLGLGSLLLLDALSLTASVAERVGARVLVVHALHDRAAAFYLRYGFARFDSQPLSLYLPMQDVRATLAAVGGR
jgi:ribosomal protein S18 acetylase RimI-like enzyme